MQQAAQVIEVHGATFAKRDQQRVLRARNLRDGAADLDLLLGADVPAGLGWLHCRLKDDGEFTVPRSLVPLLPPHSAERPWLARLSRSREVPIPGFEALPLRLELSDSAWLQ